MDQTPKRQLTENLLGHLISYELKQFILDVKARNRSPKTVWFYNREIQEMIDFFQDLGVETMEEIEPRSLRLYFVHKQETRNTGNVHGRQQRSPGRIDGTDR